MNRRQALRLTVVAIGPILAWVSLRTFASDSAPAPPPPSETELGALEGRFRDTVHPFLGTYCAECHGKEKPKGGLDLSAYARLEEVARDLAQWETIAEQLETRTMPPAKAKRHPPGKLRGEVVAWIQAVRRREAGRNAGDPGLVFARRLSNAEYDHTIRDLTGVDIRPTREFPVDPANEAGFDNSAESLTMSPALFQWTAWA